MIYIVYGSPCSGKSTYVASRLGDDDIAYDFDRLMRATTNIKFHILDDGRPAAHKLALQYRSELLWMIREGKLGGARDIYIITSSNPDAIARDTGGAEYEITEMKVSREECHRRLDGDDERPDKDAWHAKIDEWYDEYEKRHGGTAENMKTFYLNGDLLTDEYADVYRFFGIKTGYVCPSDMRAALADADGGELTLYINSNGGQLVVGTEMYSMLRAYSGRTTAHIQSRSASAATVAMMGCQKITAEPVSLICVHNPSAYCEGDAGDHRAAAGQLDNIKESILNAYMPRVEAHGVNRADLAALMDRDEWLDTGKALEYGLIDEVEQGPSAEGIINAAGAVMIPSQKMIDEYRAYREESANRIRRAKAYFEIYK